MCWLLRGVWLVVVTLGGVWQHFIEMDETNYINIESFMFILLPSSQTVISLVIWCIYGCWLSMDYWTDSLSYN